MIEFIRSVRHGVAGFTEVATGDWLPVLCGAGGGDPPAPAPPSAAEIAAQNSQTDVNKFNLDQAKKQSAINDALMPYELTAQHLAYVDPADPTKGIRKMTPEEIDANTSPEDAQSKQVTQLANAQVIAGLKGELPVGDAATNDWAMAEQRLRSQLVSQFGPGYEGSTGGSRALAEFNRQKVATFDAVRTGRISSADAIGTRRTMELQNLTTQRIGNMQGTTNPMTASASVLKGVSDSFGDQAKQYEGAREYEGNYGAALLGQKSQLIGSGIQGGVAAGGMIGGALIL